MFEILLTPTDAGITGFKNRTETIHGLEHGPAQETRGDVEAAVRRFACRARGRGRGEGPDGETAQRSYGRPEHKFGGSFAQNQRPFGSFELRRRKFSTAPVLQGSRGYGGLY